MKFLNKIDGADKIVTDANNRLVTDVKIAEWDSKANGAHKHSTSDITDFPTSLPANGGNSDTVNGLTVQTAVPLNAKFTDTITTVNGKTGAISKADIVALGIPSQDTVVDISGKADKTYVDNKVKTDVPENAKFTDTTYAAGDNMSLTSGKFNAVDTVPTKANVEAALGYTPVNKSGDTMTGQLGVESTTFPVIDITRNTSSTGGSLYGGARLQRKTTNPTNGVGIGFYFQAPNSNKTMTHAGMFGGALGTIQAGSEKGEIVFGPSYAGQDPYTRRDLVIRAISASKAEAELNGKLTADNTVYSDAPNTVTTKKYVDDGLDSKVNNSRVLTDVPVGAKFTDTIYTHPTTHPASIIIESTTKRFVSDAEKADWNGKLDNIYHIGKTPPTDDNVLWIDTN